MLQRLHYYKALADETRLRLLHMLNFHELSVNELVNILEMGQSRVSRHLKILSSADLLSWRRDGLWVFYAAVTDGDGRAFIDAILPFSVQDSLIQADLRMAEKMMEERALKTRQFFNAIAEDWDRLSREVLGKFDLSAAIVQRMQPCETAVDLGCGTGNVLQQMLHKAENIIGVDGSPRMLELARRHLADAATRVSLRIGELDHLPLRDGEVDFASINMVLHHLPDPFSVFPEIYRILKPRGRLILTDFDRHSDETMRAEYGDRWLGFPQDKLLSTLKDAGFSIKKAEMQAVAHGLQLHIIEAERC